MVLPSALHITVSSPGGSTTSPTEAKLEAWDAEAELEAWDAKAEKASGWIFLMLEDSQKVYVTDHLDKPHLMWTALRDIHLQKKPGQRFNASFPSGRRRIRRSRTL